MSDSSAWLELGEWKQSVERRLGTLEGDILNHSHQHTHPEIIEILEHHEEVLETEETPSGDEPVGETAEEPETLEEALETEEEAPEQEPLVDPLGEDPETRPERVHLLNRSFDVPMPWR